MTMQTVISRGKTTARTYARTPISVVCAVTSLLAACAGDITSVLPVGSQQFTPPPVYQFWWTMTEACSGESGSFSDIAWYVVPDSTNISDGRDEVNGFWSSAGNKIVLAGPSQFDGSLVRHEMLHALLRAAGHSRSQYLSKCGGVVACISLCIRDAGPPGAPDSGTTTVPSDSIEVSIAFEPTAPSATALGGWFALIISARNPASHQVIVDLPPSGDDGPSFDYVWSLSSSLARFGSNDRAYDSGVKNFYAGETKREVFDLFIDSASSSTSRIPQGDYLANAAFGVSASPTTSVSLAP